MRKEGKVSKVAIYPNCKAFVLACHVDFLRPKTEKAFTNLSNEGFIVQLETMQETKKRKFSNYEDCKTDKCKK